ncbi:MAG TPA: hypothetical protein VG826_27890 [Pirellulales bacterium]|nr:hypothetical protein [Pirellulales bacterium]
MTEFLSKFDSGELIGLVAVTGGLLCGLVAIVGGLVAKCVCHAREIAFKEELLDRGMSADEIRTLTETGRHPFGSYRCHG